MRVHASASTVTPTPWDEALREDFAPWAFWDTSSPEQRADQDSRATELRARGYVIGLGCMVSRLAAVHPDTFALGDRSYVAAHAHVSGDVVIGADSSVNVAAVVRGRVQIGRAVRIGSHVSILGFEHGFADIGVELFRQPLTSAGITIGDDVWIGSHAVVLDGVRIGSHAIVGAAAVVTTDVPDWAVVVGNPARVVRDRRAPAPGAPGGHGALASSLRAFVDVARSEIPTILDTAWVGGLYRDSPSASPTMRAHCDAVELADLLLAGPPVQLTRAEHIARLRAAQDPHTGLVAELAGAAASTAVAGPGGPAPQLPDHLRAYHVLSVGHALDLLDSSFEHPVHAVTTLSPAALVGLLDRLPWRTNAWGAGALVDAVGTALTWALRAEHPLPEGLVDALVGWLVVHRDASGLWGRPSDGLLESVNGTYRAVRGTLAQWGVALGQEDVLIDTVLRRAAEVTTARDASACDALDVVHLLRWARRTRPDHRQGEVSDFARAVLEATLGAWVPNRGLPFKAGREPSLQGTEMWLAVAWYAADLLSEADALDYRPRGVHRPDPALRLVR